MPTFQVELADRFHTLYRKACAEFGVTQRDLTTSLIESFLAGIGDYDHELIALARRRGRDRKLSAIRKKGIITTLVVAGAHNAAKYLGCSIPTVRRLIASGQLKPRREAPAYGGLIFLKAQLKKVKRDRRSK